jgi:hypothetical protein
MGICLFSCFVVIFKHENLYEKGYRQEAMGYRALMGICLFSGFVVFHRT